MIATVTSLPRPPRADAVRNRGLLLEAAAAAFAEHGPEVPVAEIARRAGIGKGTVFRHFSTKEQLLAAIVCAQFDTLTTLAESLLDARDPTAALLEFMTAGVEQQAHDRVFCEATSALTRDAPEVDTAAARLYAAAESLTDRARRVGGVRADVTGRDVVLLMRGAHKAAEPLAGTEPQLWQHFLTVIFDGLRFGAAHRVVHDFG